MYAMRLQRVNVEWLRRGERGERPVVGHLDRGVDAQGMRAASGRLPPRKEPQHLLHAADAHGERRPSARHCGRPRGLQPRVLLLDEPAAGLSSAESAELARVVRRLADEWGMAILLVEHDMNFVMGVCDSVVVIDFGNKIAEGTPEEIRNDPAVVEAYLGQQSDDDLGIDLKHSVESGSQP